MIYYSANISNKKNKGRVTGMAFFSGSIYSEELWGETGLNVILPQNPKGAVKTVYLLHGMHGNHTAWIRRSRVEPYADKYGFALVMPDARNSFYADMHSGERFFTYITQELPEICGRLFGLSQKRDDVFVAGLSMGGYGAMKCALTLPGRYRAAAAISGACDILGVAEEVLRMREEKAVQLWRAVWGESGPGKRDDLFSLAKDAAAKGFSAELPVFLACGLDDELLDSNRRFSAHLINLGYNVSYSEWPGGHTWDFFDKAAELALEYFGSLDNNG